MHSWVHYPTMFSRLEKYFEKAMPGWASRGEHVYYQVLPLGTGNHNKQVVEKPEFDEYCW